MLKKILGPKTPFFMIFSEFQLLKMDSILVISNGKIVRITLPFKAFIISMRTYLMVVSVGHRSAWAYIYM